MANIQLKFIDNFDDTINSSVKEVLGNIKITLTYNKSEKTQSIFLDKSTAIKFAKTLRTEINKIQS